MLWNCCTQYASKFKNQQLPQDWKRSVFLPIPKKGNAKEYSNYCTIAIISHASKVMLKILQASFNSMWTVNFQMFKLNLEKAGQAAFRKSRGTRDQIANIHWIIKKQESSRKHLLLLYWLSQKFWLCGSQQTVENSERDGNTRAPYLPPEKSVFRSRSNS